LYHRHFTDKLYKKNNQFTSWIKEKKFKADAITGIFQPDKEEVG